MTWTYTVKEAVLDTLKDESPLTFNSLFVRVKIAQTEVAEEQLDYRAVGRIVKELVDKNLVSFDHVEQYYEFNEPPQGKLV